MRRLLTFAILVSLLFGMYSCTQQTNQQIINLNQKVYKSALKYNDLNVATTALFNILALNPTDSTYKDTLAQLYFKGRAYVQLIALANELIENRPKDTTLLEMLAVSKQALGGVKEALDDYTKLYNLNNNIVSLYQIASLQYNLKRVEELQSSLNQLYNHPDLEKAHVNINYGQGKVQKVPMKAAILNIQGVMALDAGKKDEAKQYFEQAQQVYPDFVLPKANLKAMENMKAQDNGNAGTQNFSNVPGGM